MAGFKTVFAFALVLALAAAVPSDSFAEEDTFVQAEGADASTDPFDAINGGETADDDESIHEEARANVADLLQAGKTKDACKSLAGSSAKAITDSVANAQTIMNAVPKGAACKNEGKMAVDTATAAHTKAATKAKDAKTASSTSKAHPVKFKDVTIAEIKAGDCSAFFSDPSYTAAKTAASAAGNKLAKAEGEAKVAKSALDDAVAAQKKAEYFCACNVQREHNKAKDAATKANSAENAKAWKKAHMMDCVLEGKDMSSCKVPAVPKVTVPALQAPASTTTCGAVKNGVSSVYKQTQPYGKCGYTYDKIQYLDRQHQGCGNDGLMQGWHMQGGCSNGKDRKTKNYCIKNNKFKMEFGSTTRAGSCGLSKGKPLQYLDRLSMYCKADEAIKDFKINYCGGSNMKYTATCVKVTPHGVTSHTSGCHQVKGKDVAWLDRQTVKCPGDSALQGFHLKGSGCSGGKMQYHYKCVAMRNSKGPTAPAAPVCKTESGWNYRGTPGNEDVKVISASSTKECSAKCDALAACRYFVYNSNQKKCYLKHNYLRKHKDSTCTSGLKCSAAEATNFVVKNKKIHNFASWASTAKAQVVIADFNGDGKSDAAITGPNNWGTIPVAFSNGDGTFKVTNEKVASLPGWAATAGIKVFAGDFNGDGKGDIAITGPKGWTTIPIAFGKGNGHFSVTNSAVTNFPSWASDHPHKIAADFNGDGKTDLALFGKSGWTTIPVAFSKGNGQFDVTNHAVSQFPAWAASGGIKSAAGDFNGDGHGDLAICGPKGWTTLPTAFGDGSGKFSVTNKAIKNFASWCADGVQMVATDINGDTKDDLVITGPVWSTIPVAFSKGDGTYDVINPKVDNMPKWDSESGVQIVGADFDGDGRGGIGAIGNKNWGTFPQADYQ